MKYLTSLLAFFLGLNGYAYQGAYIEPEPLISEICRNTIEETYLRHRDKDSLDNVEIVFRHLNRNLHIVSIKDGDQCMRYVVDTGSPSKKMCLIEPPQAEFCK